MNINMKMKFIINNLNKTNEFSQKLNLIASQGFVENEGLFILKEIDVTSPFSRELFFDETGYECFFNSFHIHDYVDHCAEHQALHFILLTLKEWVKEFSNHKLMSIFLITDDDIIVKFHKKRKFQEFYDSDLEKSNNAIAIFSDEDIVFLEDL